ncbi:hypothetical protein ACFUJU_36200, partial [Streptomyces sp. NPDC057235]|uniref:hypothetical protein n=1 Tax=Streptomyces sp. NPDC057235 TaxID=3346058 RepID=UPI00363BF970
QPVVPNVGVRRLESSEREGSIYWLITVPLSPQAPHAVAAPGNDYHFRVHVRNGTTTRTLAESEIAQRYRDRFHAISDDIDRLRQVADAGFGYLNSYLATEVPVGGIRASYIPLWITLAAVPAARGNRPLTTQRERQAAFERFHRLAGAGATADMQPEYPVLVGRRQLRFEGDPTGQLHQDGSFYGALPLHVSNDRREPDSPQLLYQRALEINLLVQVQAATAWAIETGASGDIVFSAMFHRFDGNDQPLRLAVSDDVFQRGPVGVLPATPAQTTADLPAIAADKREAAITAYALVSELLADMGAHEPHLLTPEGDLQLANLNSDWRAKLTGWE